MKKKKGNKLSSNIAKLWKNGFKKNKINLSYKITKYTLQNQENTLVLET